VEAVRAGRVTAAVCRVGQVLDPIDHGVNGAWPKQEWLSSLVLSSVSMGMLPDTLGPMDNVDRIPVDAWPLC
jgi:thioester reductase-like protein